MSCMTNMPPGTPTRGAGRPQGTYVMERLLDRAAAACGLARDEIRRRNLIPPEQMPYPTPVAQRDGGAMVYDSGDYPECQRRALAAAGWADFPAAPRGARREGRLIGIGLGNYVEGTGRGPFESAGIRIGPSGTIVVTTGATAQGQGVKTMLAQIAADVLHVEPADIHVIDGDTAASPLGLGAFASRQAVTAGNASTAPRTLVADKIRRTGASLHGGVARGSGTRRRCRPREGRAGHAAELAEIAHALAGVPGFALPGGLPPGLAAAVDFEPPALTYTNGTHVVEAEVDPDTGRGALLRYVVVHDCGRVINPMMLDGQVLGGVVNGIGATLYEWMRYAEDGQPLTVNYADYLLPTVDTVPPIEIHHMESPTPLNPLGVKGAAESGTIGAPAAIVSAIEDALSPLGVVIRDLPVTPARLRALIEAAEAWRMKRAAVIGGGPAGLMAAERLAAAGVAVTVYDRMASVGRKFLLAGRGGLNLTHSEPLEEFLGRYSPPNEHLRAAIEAFPPERVRAWCEALGQETFVGTSGRVFPKAMKASPLLRAWLRRLQGEGVTFAMRHRFIGWQDGALAFARPDGTIVTDTPDATVLALGGASWPRLGSDGGWVAALADAGVAVAPLQPANCGFLAPWSEPFRSRRAGAPLKRIAVTFGGADGARRGRDHRGRDRRRRNLCALGTAARGDRWHAAKPSSPSTCVPIWHEADLAAHLARGRRKESLSTSLRKTAKLSPAAIDLLREAAAHDSIRLGELPPPELARLDQGGSGPPDRHRRRSPGRSRRRAAFRSTKSTTISCCAGFPASSSPAKCSIGRPRPAAISSRRRLPPALPRPRAPSPGRRGMIRQAARTRV